MKETIVSPISKEILVLEDYFHRIGYTGPTAPTEETLRAIHYLHVLSIPFENLNPLLGMPVTLETDALVQKLIHHGRGGYCYEHNLLLSEVLQKLGFTVRGLAARVLWGESDESLTMRTHMLLLVAINRKNFIVDAGFGGMTLTGPLRLEVNVEQTTPHEPFRLLKQEDEYVMETKIRDAWKPLYRFSLQAHYLTDYRVFNYYLSTHPDSLFVKGLIAARPTPHSRYTLQNNELAQHSLEGTTKRHILTSAEELRTVLREIFGITLPEIPKLEAMLTQLTLKAPSQA
jgi:N-hydroxyarylamine O-acetyltransferase